VLRNSSTRRRNKKVKIFLDWLKDVLTDKGESIVRGLHSTGVRGSDAAYGQYGRHRGILDVLWGWLYRVVIRSVWQLVYWQIREMDLVALRSQLSSLFDDLRNLAFSDLKECNWKTQKMVVTYIVFKSFVNCNNLISWTATKCPHDLSLPLDWCILQLPRSWMDRLVRGLECWAGWTC
jgi:hypothetical protein